MRVQDVGEFRIDHSLTPGTLATIVVRPEDVTATIDTGTGGGTAPQGAPTIAGTVIDAVFLGGSSTLSIDVPGLDAPVRSTVHTTLTQQRGDRVAVTFDQRRMSAVQRDADHVEIAKDLVGGAV